MFEVEVTSRAFAQIERAAEWWAQNRPASPAAVRLDFEEAKNLLAQQPGIGARSATSKYPALRRIYLSRIRYHVYYRVTPRKVQVLAFWHTSRGTNPGV